jgi:PAS domain S-box-containing protein
MVLLILLFLVYLNHRRFTAKLAATLEEMQHQKVKLQKSEEKYRGLFDNSRDALMVLEPPLWKYTSGNQATLEMFWANSEEEFISHTPWALSPERQPDGRTSIDKAREMLEIALRDGYHLFEWTHHRICGEEFFADVFLTRLEEEGKVMVQATVRDITDRKRTEEALQEQKKQLKDIINFLPDATLAIDKNKHVIIWNRAIEEMTGVPASEMIGKGDYAYTIPFYGEARPQLMDLVFENRDDIASYYNYLTRSGDSFTAEVFCNALYNNKGAWLLLTASPLQDQSGNIIGAIESIRDITGRKQTEEENLLLEQQFHHAQKLESLGVLAGGIAHDFNNILTVILGHCFMAGEGMFSEQELKASFLQVEAAANRAADLCRQMLSYAGKSQLAQTPLDLWQLIDEVVKMLQAAFKKNVTIELDFNCDNSIINGDIGQIQQVIMNLIINAAEAIGDINGTIKITLTKMIVEKDTTETDTFGKALVAGKYACLEVADTGCGMDVDTQKRIFEPFYTTKFTGRGLGMSAICGIVTSHEGLLQLTSTPGVGTTFKVCFPLPEASEFPEVTSASSIPYEKSVGTILLVEDEQTLRVIGTAVLETFGHSVITAQHGLEALEIFQSQGSKIDVILLDLLMPVMGGIETYHELRRIAPTLPIIICSGYDTESVNDVIGNDLHAGFVHKPYKPDELRNMMIRMMDQVMR